MDWASIVRKEYEYLKAQKEDQLIRIWHDNLLATSVATQAKEQSSAKWNAEGDPSFQTNANISNGEVILSAQTPSPSFTTWLPISRNFVTKDIEDLKGTPHLSDDTYYRNLRDTKCELIDNEMFVSLVRRMIPYQNSMTASSTQIVYGHQSVESTVGEGVVENVIFESISSYFDDENYTAARYEKLTKCNTPSCTPNIDEPMESPIQPHESLHAYHKYFCRRCCVYNCQLHPPAGNFDESSIMRRIVDEFKRFTEPCSTTCYLTKEIGENTLVGQNTANESLNANNISDFGDLFTHEWVEYLEHSFAEISSSNHPSNLSEVFEELTTNDSGISTQESQSPIAQPMARDADGSSDPETEWSPSDLSVFLVLFNVFPYNCCAIAKTMSKSCEQVHKKMALMDPPARKEIEKKSSRRERSKCYGKLQKHLAQTYSPCNHKGRCHQTTNCKCVNCEKYCSCGPECGKRMPKCACKGSCATKRCICYSDQRECDDECECCHTCKNMEIQIGRAKKLEIMASSIHGWGVFIVGTCQKDDFISEYKGEIISNKECERREKIYDRSHCTYMFSLNSDSLIDARFFGNKLRFLNFSEKPNCYCRVMMANGDHRIGVYASRDIEAGEELTIDYLTYDPTQPMVTK